MSRSIETAERLLGAAFLGASLGCAAIGAAEHIDAGKLTYQANQFEAHGDTVAAADVRQKIKGLEESQDDRQMDTFVYGTLAGWAVAPRRRKD